MVRNISLGEKDRKFEQLLFLTVLNLTSVFGSRGEQSKFLQLLEGKCGSTFCLIDRSPEVKLENTLWNVRKSTESFVSTKSREELSSKIIKIFTWCVNQ